MRRALLAIMICIVVMGLACTKKSAPPSGSGTSGGTGGASSTAVPVPSATPFPGATPRVAGDNSARHTGAFTTSADSRRDPAIASSYARHYPSCTGSAFTNTESNAPCEPGSEEEDVRECESEQDRLSRKRTGINAARRYQFK